MMAKTPCASHLIEGAHQGICLPDFLGASIMLPGCTFPADHQAATFTLFLLRLTYFSAMQNTHCLLVPMYSRG